MNVTIWSRNFVKPSALPGLVCSVEALSWAAIGGPEKAQIRVEGRGLELQPVSSLLRCGVSVSDEGGPAWWGYVNQVELHLDGAIFTYDLADMANRMAARWRDEAPTAGGNAGWQWQTAWADDLNSQRQYGVKEAILSIGEGRQDEAIALRDQALNARKIPDVKVRSVLEPVESPFVVLHCLGWWASLGWRYYSEARGYEGNDAGGTLQSIGNVAATTMIGQRVVLGSAAGWGLKEAWVKLRTVGAPADTIGLQLVNDVAGLPGGSLLASGAVAANTLTDSLGWTRFVLAPVYNLAVSTPYWFCLLRSGGLDAVNYYQAGVDEGLHYTRGVARVFNSGVGWVARVPDADLVFSALGEDTTTAQISSIGASTAGQFLAGVMIKDGPGINARLYRSGKNTALREALDLLAMGDPNGRRLLATVTAERVLVVKAAPTPGIVDLVLDSSERLHFRDGRRILGSDHPAGRWARLAGLPAMGGDAGPAGLVFVERCEWINGAMRIK